MTEKITTKLHAAAEAFMLICQPENRGKCEGTIRCPACEGQFAWWRDPGRKGHLRGRCDRCGLQFME